ncbi:transcriptional regulator, AraC family [Chitinophaga costaii]|uniref:Transcriptional regulator, AraC family n=1 Tax=Chitinophaga costaii TaxID=1335309 RepID=A0A1C4EYD0_9BACT|nr:helix-turn-helix transcriptional regulator [Chitinophaga costaii]PUZ21549.1 AraC family transcriptional regulator [Chitinophaga costaii]SCC48657.1 transcriptional regulator, AraC family [Chitinophaga costaii]
MAKRIKTISEFHQLRGLPKPEHPLISVIDVEAIKHLHHDEPENLLMDFYVIALKKNLNNSQLKYGQQQYDFDSGVMFFMSPNQIFTIVIDNEKELKQSGWALLLHPDFLWNTSLTNTIKHCDFFDYSVNEALFLSEKEQETLNNIIENIRQECHNNIDKYSKQIIISHIESLLNYSERFYNRQFITRDKSHHQILERLEKLLADYFNSDDLMSKGLPTVRHIAQMLNLSPQYLSGLLKVLTGQSTQQHIHEKLIEKAKEKLSTTDLPVSEIAYELGFEHSQSFSKLFKTKTNQSPLEFRAGFN